MRTTISLSISDHILKATKKWAESENRPVSRHIEMILSAALKKTSKRPKSRTQPTPCGR